MNFLDTHELAISTLSPVHVGCGEDYEPTNYVIDGETLYAFDPHTLMARLEQRQRDELSRALDDRNPVLAAQRFFYRHKTLAMEIARHRAPVAPAAARLYASRVGQVANREQGGRQVINKLEIARNAFNPVSGWPMLPGSGLKGAMRTAIVEKLRGGQRYPLADQEAGSHFKASGKARDMERDILKGSFQTDPLRLLKIGDCAFRPGKVKNARTGEETPKLARSILFQANRKKRPNQFDASGSIETLVECIPAGQPKAFAGQMAFERKANRGDQTPTRQIDLPFLVAACNDFYLARFEQELAMLEQNQYVSATWAANARKRLAPDGLWGKLIVAGEGFLLRIGRHSGAESVTVDAPRKINIMKGRGNPVEWHSAATTIWLAANEPGANEGMQPFGWVFVQVK
jgi:CRISPR-associated protein Csm5